MLSSAAASQGDRSSLLEHRSFAGSFRRLQSMIECIENQNILTGSICSFQGAAEFAHLVDCFVSHDHFVTGKEAY
jgi:hypothetical protein